MAGYTPATASDQAEMLAAIGVSSIDELFEQIPADIRLNRELDLEDGMSESEVYRFLAGLADMNLDAERIPSFLGAGMYDHYVPAIVDAIARAVNVEPLNSCSA